MFKIKEMLELKRNMIKTNKKSGFSLMELIIVIVIIGILIAAVVGLSGQKETAKAAAAEQVIMQISNATQSWAVQQGSENFTLVNLPAVVATGILPAGFTTARANPWAGNITVTVAPAVVPNSINHYVITLTNVPTQQCTTLINKFTNKTIVVPVCTPTAGSSSFAATF
jgi:prepilin-type N-terminal cleavage/methylation domain-containing protein